MRVTARAMLLLAAAAVLVPLLPALLAGAIAAPASAAATSAQPKVVFDQPSAYGRVIVVEHGRRRMLRFDDVDGVDQSIMSLDDPASVPMEYVRYAGLGLLFVPEPAHVLMIGLGGGSFSGLMHRARPAARIDVVEINPVVVEAARRFFGLVEDDNYRVHVADGASFVRDAGPRYDLILADAGIADGIPEPHTTDPFFTALRGRLAVDGVLVVNLGLDERGNALIAGRIARAFAGGTRVCARTPTDANLVVFATMNPATPDAVHLRARAATLDGEHRMPYALAPLAARLGPCP